MRIRRCIEATSNPLPFLKPAQKKEKPELPNRSTVGIERFVK